MRNPFSHQENCSSHIRNCFSHLGNSSPDMRNCFSHIRNCFPDMRNWQCYEKYASLCHSRAWHGNLSSVGILKKRLCLLKKISAWVFWLWQVRHRVCRLFSSKKSSSLPSAFWIWSTDKSISLPQSAQYGCFSSCFRLNVLQRDVL